MRLGRRHWAIVAAMGIVLAACSGTPSGSSTTTPPASVAVDSGGATPSEAAGPLDTVTLRLGWTYGGPFAPFYLGDAMGFFEDQGIDLEILEGNGTIPSAEAVGNGEDDFGYVDTAAAARLIDQGLPIKTVAQIRQVTSMAVIAPTTSGISSPEDLAGKSVSHTPGDSLSQIFPAYIRVNELDSGAIEQPTLDYSVYLQAVADGEVDAILGYTDWEGFTLESQDIDIDTLLFADSGVNIVDYGVVTSQELIDQDPDLVRRFLAATVQSWSYAVDNVDEAVAAGQELFPEFDEELARRQVESLPDWFGDSVDDGRPIGWVEEEVWATTLDILNEFMGVENTNPSDYFTNDFLPEG